MFGLIFKREIQRLDKARGQGNCEAFFLPLVALIVASRVMPSTPPHSLRSPPLRYGLAVTAPHASLGIGH